MAKNDKDNANEVVSDTPVVADTADVAASDPVTETPTAETTEAPDAAPAGDGIAEALNADAAKGGAPGVTMMQAITDAIEGSRQNMVAALTAPIVKHDVKEGDTVTVISNFDDFRNPGANNGQGFWFRKGTPETVVADKWLVHQLNSNTMRVVEAPAQ